MILVILIICVGIPCVAAYFLINESRCDRDEKLGIGPDISPYRRDVNLPQQGPHAFAIGDKVRALNPPAAGFTTGTVEGLYWPDKPFWMFKANTTMPVRDDVTGKTIWMDRYWIEKVA